MQNYFDDDDDDGNNNNNNNKGKSKVTLEQTTKAQRKSGGIDLLFL